MQLNIKGLNDSELMDWGASHLSRNISYESHLDENLVESPLPVSDSIVEYDMITGHPYDIGNMDDGSLDDSHALRTPAHITNF